MTPPTATILDTNIFDKLLQNSITLNSIVRHEFETTHHDLPKNTSSVRLIIKKLESNKSIALFGTPYHTHKLNINQLAAIDVLTLLHLPHEGKYRELFDLLINQVEKFIFQVVLMLFRFASLTHGKFIVTSSNFIDLQLITPHSYNLLIYFIILNNPRIFRLRRVNKTDNKIKFHPNSQLIVSRLIQKIYYRKVIRILYEKSHQITKCLAHILPTVEFDIELIKKSRNKEIAEDILKASDRHIFVEYSITDSGKLIPELNSVDFNKANTGSKALKVKNDPSIRTLKLFSEERKELITLGQEKIFLHKMMTFEELLIGLNEIFHLDDDEILLRSLRKLKDPNVERSLDDLISTAGAPTLIGTRLGKTLAFAEEVKRKMSMIERG